MRSRFNCLLLDAGPGRLEAVGDVLSEAGALVERVPMAAAADCPPAEATVILADAKDPAAVDLLRRIVTAAWLRARSLVVLARAGDTATISRAVAAGADDAVCTPLDEHELLERLDSSPRPSPGPGPRRRRATRSWRSFAAPPRRSSRTTSVAAPRRGRGSCWSARPAPCRPRSWRH